MGNRICQKGFNWKIKIILLLTFLFTFIYFVDLFFDNYDLKFQSPIILRTPVILEKRETPKNIKNLPKNSPKQGGKSNLPRGILAQNSSKSKIEPTITPKPKTEKEIIFSKKHGEILWKIYGLESSWGRNDSCRERGKYNGFGYGQNSYVWNCFDSFEEVVEKVNNWFDKRLKENGNDLTEALCYYNLGLAKQVNCKYYHSFISL